MACRPEPPGRRGPSPPRRGRGTRAPSSGCRSSRRRCESARGKSRAPGRPSTGSRGPPVRRRRRRSRPRQGWREGWPRRRRRPGLRQPRTGPAGALSPPSRVEHGAESRRRVDAGDPPVVRPRSALQPGRLVAQTSPGAEVPAERASGAHLHEHRQVVLADPDRVRRTGGDTGPALHAAVRVDDCGGELPEPHLSRRFGDPVHLRAKAERGGQLRLGAARPDGRRPWRRDGHVPDSSLGTDRCRSA